MVPRRLYALAVLRNSQCLSMLYRLSSFDLRTIVDGIGLFSGRLFMVGQFAFDLRLDLGDLVIDAILFLVSKLPRLVEL